MILIYGAYGYTGKLIVDEAIRHNLPVTLAGRNLEKTEKLAKSKELPFISFSLDEHNKVAEILNDFDMVIHCAGPFEFTAEVMARACLLSNTHYIDITGEYQVFRDLHNMDVEAKTAGIMLMPGAGFDVVPSDCLANQLKDAMPNATSLTLAFTSTGASLSRGTAKTMVQNIHVGQLLRKDGKLVEQKHAKSVKKIDYGSFEQISVGISWGDICTAYYSTGIKNIEVFTGSTNGQIKQMKKANWLKPFLKWKWVKNIFTNKIDKKPAGPSSEKRKKANMYLWGTASNGKNTIEKRLKTPNGYTLTAESAVLIAKKITSGDYKSGYQTPAMAYGKDLIFECSGVEWVEK